MSGAAVHAYASAATIRRRVFRRFAQDAADIDRLAREVAVLKAAAYEGRLQQLADAAGLGREVALSDPEVLRRLVRDSRDAAAGIVRTHNQDLRRFLAAQPRGTSQRELAARTRAHLEARAVRKAADIARTEGMAARNEAAIDVLRKNGIKTRVRAEPRRAAEPNCAAIVQAGWYEIDRVPSLPAHPRCIHSWAYADSFVAAARARDLLWLGDWEPVERKRA